MASSIGPGGSNPAPRPATTRKVPTRLEGPEYGPFDGAVIYTEVDVTASFDGDVEVDRRTKGNLKRLIDQGRIRYNEPGYEMKIPEDYFDSQRRPYIGVVRWKDGHMVIERLPVATR